MVQAWVHWVAGWECWTQLSPSEALAVQGPPQLYTDPWISHWSLAKFIPCQGPPPHVPAPLGAEGGVLGQTGCILHFLKALRA